MSFSFGAPAAPTGSTASTGFTFGAPAATPAAPAAPASTGFSFGTPATTTTAPAAPAAPASTGFTFGAPAAATTAPAAPASTGFSFGTPAAATTAPAAPASTGFSFGAPTTAPAAPASTGFSFGAPASGSTGGFGFGAPAAAPAAPQQPTQPQPYQPFASGAILPLGGYVRDVQDPVIKRINDISDSINIASPNCLLQYVLYNILPPNSPFKDRLTRPPHANPDVWARGVSENPDPEKFVPCLVVGWPDLLIRIQEQQQALNTHIATMQHLSTDVTSSLLNTQQSLHRNIEDSKQRQTILTSRLFNLVSRIQAIKCGNTPLTEAEQQYKQRLINLVQQLSQSEVGIEKVNSLHDLIIAQSNSKERKSSRDRARGSGNSDDDYDEDDEDDGDDYDDNNDNKNEFDNHQNDDQNDDGYVSDGDYHHTEFGSLRRMRGNNNMGSSNQPTKPSLKTLLSVLNDQSLMIKELVDEISLCTTDLQVCAAALRPSY
jgi:hypothetical protein